MIDLHFANNEASVHHTTHLFSLHLLNTRESCSFLVPTTRPLPYSCLVTGLKLESQLSSSSLLHLSSVSQGILLFPRLYLVGRAKQIGLEAWLYDLLAVQLRRGDFISLNSSPPL